MVIILLFALCFFNHYCITPTGTFCILRFKRCKYFILIKCVRRVLPGTLFKDNRFAILRCDFSAIAQYIIIAAILSAVLSQNCTYTQLQRYIILRFFQKIILCCFLFYLICKNKEYSFIFSIIYCFLMVFCMIVFRHLFASNPIL